MVAGGWLLISLAVSASALVTGRHDADISRKFERRASPLAPVVSLTYGKFQGLYNSTTGFNIFRGIRYAAPPKRWQPPQPPEAHPNTTYQALSDPPRCPQSPIASTQQGRDWDVFGNEDCLFLNVFAPAKAKKLPVLVWIHGGGYGIGSAAGTDFTGVAQRVGNGFISVIIQYRLGAFGFASSEDIKKNGVLNAGLHDMHFALEWVQQQIESFGGDPTRVTIAGESAGGGAVMLLNMVNDGTDGVQLFRGSIASSPYLPTQPDYNDGINEEYYRLLVEQAGCSAKNSSVFDCLSTVDTATLQNASALVTGVARYGVWNFVPVTDGTFLTQRPSQQLLKGRTNGKLMLVSNNGNEAFYFVPQNITTKAQFTSYVQLYYPHLSAQNLTAVHSLYDVPSNSSTAGPKFDSNGLNAPYATEISSEARGWQQAANNLYAETTFVCPAYWLADAFSSSVNTNGRAKSAWRYQYSVPPALHGSDLGPILDDSSRSGTNLNQNFRRSFQSIWGHFITRGNPSLPPQYNETTGTIKAAESDSWKRWGVAGDYAGGDGHGYALLNVNVTGQTMAATPDWKVVDGNAWENGRGARCALWAELGPYAQE